MLAPAKINLTLHVTGQRDDGYHLLDSLVVFAEVGDLLTFHKADAISIAVRGPFAAGVPADARNLVWRAADLAGVTPHVELEKNLPHGAGIGGGSSDAAAVLRAFGGGAQAAELGADVPVCLSRDPQRMQGIGDVLSPVTLCGFDIVLVNPGEHVPTPDVFKALSQKRNPAMPKLPDMSAYALACGFLKQQRNDLQPAALRVAPAISAALSALEEDADLARMSGSGSTCFGIYPNARAAQYAASRIAAAHPEWWVVASRTFASPNCTAS